MFQLSVETSDCCDIYDRDDSFLWVSVLERENENGRETRWQFDVILPSPSLSSATLQTAPWNVTLCWHRECVHAFYKNALEEMDFERTVDVTHL